MVICSSRGGRNESSAQYSTDQTTRFITILDPDDIVDDPLGQANRAPECILNEQPPAVGGGVRDDLRVDMPEDESAPKPSALGETVEPVPEPEPEPEPAPEPAPAPEPVSHIETSAGIDPSNAPNALPLAKLQVLSGAFAGRELELTKALTTLGRPGVQVAAITRRAEGYFVVHVESGEEGDYPLVNGQPIGAQARKLTDNDVLQLAGVKMGFFSS